MAETQAETDKRAADQAKAAQDADKKRQDEVRKKISEERSAREKAAKEGMDYSAANVKPTPTQEENDLSASGVHLPEHEPDGSPEQDTGFNPLTRDAPLNRELNKNKDKDAKPDPQSKAGYATRSTQPDR